MEDKVSLIEVCDFEGGNQPPKSDFIDFPQSGYIRMLQIRDFESDTKAVYIPDKIKLKKCNIDDVLLARYGASVGKILTGKEGAYNVALMKAIPNSKKIHKRFIYYVLNSRQFQVFIKTIAESRAAQDGFNKKDLSRFFFYLPDLNKQEKIITQLDILQELVNSKLEVTSLLNNLLENIFVDFIFKNEGYDTWDYSKLNNYIEYTKYGIASELSYDSGYPVVRMNNISYLGDVVLDNLKYVELDDKTFKKYELKEREIIFNRTNSLELVGKCAVWGTEKGFVFAGYLFSIKLNEKVLNPYYLCSYLNSDLGKKILYNKARQSGNMANFSASLLRNQKISIPPIAIQNEYEVIYKEVKGILSVLNLSIQFVQDLFQAILQNAFKEGAEIDEESIFEELIQKLTLDDFKSDKRRLQYLINLLQQEQFKNLSNYSDAKEKLFTLMAEEEIIQMFNNDEVTLKVK